MPQVSQERILRPTTEGLRPSATASDNRQRRAAAAHTEATERGGWRVRGQQARERWLAGLSVAISLLALAATTTGIFTADGRSHRAFLSLRGQQILLQGGGLYANESVSGAAQAIGQDVVTLLLGVPLLIAATGLAARGSMRARVLQTGMLWYFLYTYLLMAFGSAYNSLFLVYVAIYSASLFAFVLALLSIDADRLRAGFSRRFLRRLISWGVIAFGALLALLWLGRIVPALISGAPPVGLESYNTLFVQAGDLGLILPLAIVTGALLLRNHPVGYLLAGVLLVKGAAFGLALIAMMLAMSLAGVSVALVEVVFFVTVAVVCVAGSAHYLLCSPRTLTHGQAV